MSVVVVVKGGAAMVERVWSADVQAIGDRIVTLTPAKAGELQRYLDVIYGLKPGMFPILDVRPVPPEPEPTVWADPVFDVVLESVDPVRRIVVIKALRDLLPLGLREARDLMEQAPSMIAKGLAREEAERFQQELRLAGAKVVVKARREEC